jgi:hypothetical protein
LVNPFQKIKSKIQANKLQKESVKRFQGLLQSMSGKIQALTEGGQDVLTPEVLDDLAYVLSGSKQPDKNNHRSYSSQIQAIYQMYFNESYYGGEIARGIIDTRVAMLCGEGINVIVFDSPEFLEMQKAKKEEEVKQLQSQPQPTQAKPALPAKVQSLEVKKETNIKVKEEPKDVTGEVGEPQTDEEVQEEEITDEKKKQVKEFVNKFLKWNKLQGEGLIEIGECGEREGKVLLVLNPVKVKDETIIKVEVFDYYTNKYDIERKNGEITKITYTKNMKTIPIPVDRAVFIQLSGLKKDYVKTPPRIANVLTQIENYSRAKYDLRKNNHLFSKTTPFFKTLTQGEAASINNDIASKKWIVGMGYAGSADFSYVSQDTGASTCINEERIMDMKDIATTIGLPIFFMNYPELMSNRAVADTMMESVNQSTKKERLIYQSAMIELIQKAMQLAVDSDVEGAIYEPDMFDVNIPLITLDSLKSLIEIWCVLMDKGVVAKKTVQGKIPGINPIDEEKQIQEEKQENIANNPIVQGTMGDIMDEAKTKANVKMVDDSTKQLQKAQAFRGKKRWMKN